MWNDSCCIGKFEHFQHPGQTDIQRGYGLLAVQNLFPCLIRLRADKVNEILIAASVNKLAVQVIGIADFNNLKPSFVLLRIKLFFLRLKLSKHYNSSIDNLLLLW